PKKETVAIYERLFSDGVMVAKKDPRPNVTHPQVTGVRNLHVVKALISLKSRGFVREQFAWRHYYWFLTNEGIEFLRKYLHLPTECVPATLSSLQPRLEKLSNGNNLETDDSLGCVLSDALPASNSSGV
ncbi:hypothetical protein BOX15_Mlig012831g2, partial [Macrostomum lignano]